MRLQRQENQQRDNNEEQPQQVQEHPEELRREQLQLLRNMELAANEGFGELENEVVNMGR